MVAHGGSVKRKVEILLMGQRFTVRSDRDDTHIDRLSRMVNEQLDDIKKNTKTVSSHHVALLAALNIADELIRTQEALAKAEETLAIMKHKAQASLREVNSALSFLPVELRGQDDRPEHNNPPMEEAPSFIDSPKIA